MRILLIIICLILILLQLAMTYVWTETGVIEQFSRIFYDLYDDGVPMWSEIAFSMNRLWYLSFLVFTALLLYFSLFTKRNFALYSIVACAFISLLSMVYAMYPLHLMFGVI